MKKNNAFILVGIALLLVIGASMTGLFSLIDFGDARPSVEITDTNQIYNIEFTLEANREYTEFVPNFDFGGVPDAEYKTGGVLTHLDSYSGVDGDEKETHYLYEPKEEWGNIYDLEVTAITSADQKITSGAYKSNLDIFVNGVRIDYPSDSIKVCTARSQSDCPPDTLINQDGDDISLLNTDRRLFAVFSNVMSSSDVALGLHTNVLEAKGIVGNKYMKFDNPKFTVKIGEEVYRGTLANVQKPPLVSANYKNMNYPNNVQYGVNGQLFEQLNGEQTDLVSGLDLSNVINNACNRGKNNDACTFTLSFKSQTKGTIYIDSIEETKQLSEIIPIEEEPPIDDGAGSSTPTGFAVGDLFDYENNPTTAWTTTAILFSLFIAGILFFPLGGKKK